MTNLPIISVIIVNWNGLTWIEKCLGSLLAQTYQQYEIIIVDNGSSDGSVDFINTRYPTVKVVVSSTNIGFAGGNNLGIKQAKGEFILLINNDTWVEETFIEDLIFEFLERKLDVIGPREADYYTKEKSIPYASKIDPLGYPVYEDDFTQESGSFYLTGVCLLFRQKMYLQTGGLDSDFFMYYEEVDWFWRLNLLGCSFDYSKSIFVYHAGMGSTAKGLNYKRFLWNNQNTLQMLLKNYFLGNLLWVLPLYFAQNILEIAVFLLFMRPKIAASYVMGIWFNIKLAKSTYNKRRDIRKSCLVRDVEILKKMAIKPGKLIFLRRYLQQMLSNR